MATSAALRRVLFVDPHGPVASRLLGHFKQRGDGVFVVGKKGQPTAAGQFSSAEVTLGDAASFKDAIQKAKSTFNGSAPDVLIVNAGCGRYGLLSPREGQAKPSDGITKDDLENLKSNLQTSYQLLCSVLPEIATPKPEAKEGESAAPTPSPCHVIVMGSSSGIRRETSAGSMYTSRVGLFLDSMRQSFGLESNVNLTLIDLEGDFHSSTGRVVMYDTKQEYPYASAEIEDEVTNAVTTLLEIPECDVAKVVWPNYRISPTPVFGDSFQRLFKNSVIPKSDKFVLEKPQEVAAPAVSENASVAEEAKAPPPPEVQKTIFSVILTEVADMDKNKLKVIKAIRGVKPEDSLVQCKEYLSKLPAVLFRDVPKDQAEKIEAAFKDTGAVIKLD